MLSSFLISCTAPQPVVSSPSKSPVEVKRPQVSYPSLGRPISIPTTTEPIATPRTPPIRRQEPKNGKTAIVAKFKLPNRIRESSGLIKVDNRLWTFNDSKGRAELYQISERNGDIIKTLKIKNARNRDWEDIAYDDNYVYIGDIGNNKGNRRDLKVYKIPRASLGSQKSVRAGVISFRFSDQKKFKSKAHNSNYDCEAMVAHHGKLYLFSKDWQDNKTRLYELTTQTGKHIAKYIATFNTQGMVTGADINEELGILLLTTYSSLLNVNIWAFTNYSGNNFFNGDHKRLHLKEPLTSQVEGITFKGSHKAYMSSEAFHKYIFTFDSMLYEIDFSGEFE